MPRAVITLLHFVWVVLLVIFGGLVVTNTVGGLAAAIWGAVILTVMGLELWGRYRLRGLRGSSGIPPVSPHPPAG
jgi:hypothetical protein